MLFQSIEGKRLTAIQKMNWFVRSSRHNRSTVHSGLANKHVYFTSPKRSKNLQQNLV